MRAWVCVGLHAGLRVGLHAGLRVGLRAWVRERVCDSYLVGHAAATRTSLSMWSSRSSGGALAKVVRQSVCIRQAAKTCFAACYPLTALRRIRLIPPDRSVVVLRCGVDALWR